MFDNEVVRRRVPTGLDAELAVLQNLSAEQEAVADVSVDRTVTESRNRIFKRVFAEVHGRKPGNSRWLGCHSVGFGFMEWIRKNWSATCFRNFLAKFDISPLLDSSASHNFRS